MGSGELSVAVLGAGGYVGGELLRLLAQHPAVGRLRAYSGSQAGKAWSEVHPTLLHLEAGVFEPPDVEAAGRDADVVFLAMPHGRSQELMGELLAAGPRLVVDTAADFRLRRAPQGHRSPELVGTFAYGLADVVGAGLEGAQRIAAPGCFATASLLALYPFARSGVLAGEATVFAVTGSSGAGAEPRRTTHHPVRAHSFFAYALAGHRHEPEIAEQVDGWAGEGVRCRLLPHSAPLVRGIHATARLHLRRRIGDPQALLRETYHGRPFVRVTASPPELASVVGTNFAHIHAVADGDAVVVTVTIDNLVKGAAGQAVQAANLALGFDESAGLTFPGVFPC